MPSELERIEALRELFLRDPKGVPDYWTADLLEAYDRTLGRRIGWKWDAVLADLLARPGLPPLPSRWVDWGCGTGIAARRLLARLPPGPKEAWLVDRSPLAIVFAERRLREEVPGVTVERGLPPVPGHGALLSHVLNELTPEGERDLVIALSKASWIVWVEPGTPAHSQALVGWRGRLLAGRSAWAPCPHSGECGLPAPDRALGWCHQFAAPPASASEDEEWARIVRRLGLDPRSLPLSYLVLGPAGAAAPGPARLLGRPRFEKGRATAVWCEPDGRVTRRIVTKRRDPETYRALRKGKGLLG